MGDLLLAVVLHGMQGLRREDPALERHLRKKHHDPHRAENKEKPPDQVQQGRAGEEPFPVRDARTTRPRTVHLSQPAYRETLLAGIHQQAAQGIQGKVQAADQGILHTYLPQDFRALCLRADGTLGRGPDPAQPDIPPFQPGNHPALHRAGAGGHRQSVRFHTSMRIFSTMPGTGAGNNLCTEISFDAYALILSAVRRGKLCIAGHGPDESGGADICI